MTEEAPKITSAIKTPREKNPGRVAAGKRLAAISKEAKERKKLEREKATGGSAVKESSETNFLVVGVVVAVVAGAAVYFLTKVKSEPKEPKAREVVRRVREILGSEEPCEACEPKEPKEPSVARNSNDAPLGFKIYSMDD